MTDSGQVNDGKEFFDIFFWGFGSDLCCSNCHESISTDSGDRK